MNNKSSHGLRDAALSFLLLIFTIGIGLLGAEFFLRQLDDADSAELKQGFYRVEGDWYKRRVPPYDIALLPNGSPTIESLEFKVQYFFNSLGYRDYEFARQKPEDTYRIAVVGDSLTFGTGVELESVFSKQLEKKLKAAFTENIEVLNLGIGAASAGQNYLRALHDGLALDADLIVLVTYANDAMEWPHYTDPDTGLPQSYLVTPEHWDKTRAKGKNQIVQLDPIAPPEFLVQASQSSKLAALILKAWNIKLNPPKRSAGSSYDYGDPWNDPFWPLRENVDYSRMSEWQYHVRILQATAQGVVKNGKKILTVILPPGHLVNDFEWDVGRQLHHFAAGYTHDDKPLRDIYDVFQDMGVPVLYLKGALAEASSPEERLYYPYDGHLTPRGHAVVGNALFDKVKSLAGLGDMGE